MSHLELRDLCKRYDGSVAVDGLNLSVDRGEFVALLGPSGCGKTTTLQMIAGFVQPSSGSILLEGRDLAAVRPAERGMGIVFQSYALFPHMTAAQNIAFGLEMRGISSDEKRRRVGELLELVGLSALADRYPRRMSGGQQQRVALARALVIRPSILLLDEPLSNLDAKLREDMQIELRQIQRSLGTTTILVTHDQSEAMALADRIVVMNRGRVEQIGPPHETYEWPATAFVADFLGRTNVLNGELHADRTITIAGETLRRPLDPSSTLPPTGSVQIAIRPEKLRLTRADKGAVTRDASPPGEPSAAPAGRVQARIFQGNHWLYQVESLGQLLTIIGPNDGAPPFGEGESVQVLWDPRDFRLRAAPSQ